MTARTIVITGANRGIGYALADHYVKNGDSVIAVVRRTSDALDALGCDIIDGIDLTAEGAAAAVDARLGDRPVDMLLNVAGIMLWEKLDTLDPALIRQQFEVNTIAPLLLAAKLADRMTDGGKIFFWSTRLGSIADNESGAGYGYRLSKAALNMAAKTLAIDLKSRGIAVQLLHPGSVQTSLNKLGGEIPVDESVRGLVARIDELTLAETGTFRHQNGINLAW